MKNITVRDLGKSFAKIKGMEGAEITNLIFENVYLPGSGVPAKTLYEMNFLDKAYYSGVTILPIQEPEPKPRTNLALHQPAFISAYDNPNLTVSLAFDGLYSTRTSTKRGGRSGLDLRRSRPNPANQRSAPVLGSGLWQEISNSGIE